MRTANVLCLLTVSVIALPAFASQPRVDVENTSVLEGSHLVQSTLPQEYQLDRAWANTSKGIRQCQKADKELAKGNVDSASKHYDKALEYFAIAADHLQKAEDKVYAKVGSLLNDGNQELQKAIDKYNQGDIKGADKHYESAMEKYDEALNEVS